MLDQELFSIDPLKKINQQITEAGPGDVVGKAGSMINDALKATVDVDAEKIVDSWKSGGDIGSSMKTTAGELSKGADNLETMDKMLGKHRVDTRSIVARARNSILQFPVYITQTNRVNAAHTISKMLERVYASFVQNVLAQYPIMNEEEANNMVFLKKFHSNINESTLEDIQKMYESFFNEFYEPIDELDAMMTESVFHTININEYCSLNFRVVPPTDQELIAENARLMNEPLTGLSYLREAKDEKLTDSKTEDSYNYVTVKEDELRSMARERANLSNAEKLLMDTSDKDLKDDNERKKKRAARNKVENALTNLRDDIKNGKVSNYSIDNAGRVRRYERTIKKTKERRREEPVQKAVDAPTLLKEADIKKVNGMLPWQIVATFRLRTKNGIDRDVKYVIGIKTVLHLIRTQDLAEDLQELITGDMKSLRKVRYKTGEISFKDYMFNVKGLKADAAKHINYNKRWINTLKRLADYKKMNGALMKTAVSATAGGGVPIPNGTLVLAQPDVTTLTNQTGIDLSNVSNAKRLAKSLFLIAVAIVDASAGTMRVLFPDSDTDWDVQSLAAIDAELAKTDNSQLMKELNRMVNR